MATTRKTKAAGAKPAAAGKQEKQDQRGKGKVAGSEGEQALYGVQREAENTAIGSAETVDGRPVTSTSNAPGVVPTAEVAGAGADRAAATDALRVEKGLVVTPSIVRDAKNMKSDMKADDMIDSAPPGTAIIRSGVGITLSVPIGGGATRSFGGASLKEAIENMQAFLRGENQTIVDIGLSEKDRKRAEREAEAERQREDELDKAAERRSRKTEKDD
jgi:hypothetical protein